MTATELHRIELVDSSTNPLEGTVRWAPAKSLWLLAHSLVAIVGGLLTMSVETFMVFVVTTAVTLCLGHSLGMHRKLIHNSYQCPAWLEYFWVHLGTIVGLAHWDDEGARPAGLGATPECVPSLSAPRKLPLEGCLVATAL